MADDYLSAEWSTIEPQWQRAWERAGRAPRTLYTYRLEIDHYLTWCKAEGKRASAFVSADEYVSVCERRGAYAGRNAAKALKALGKYLNQLYDDGDPFRRLVVPVPAPPTRTPAGTDDALAKLLATCDKSWTGQRDRAIIVLLANTGMRRGEVANMSPADLDLATSRLVIPKTKTKSPRTVYLSAEVVEAIMKYRKVAPTQDVCWPSATDKALGKWQGMQAGGIGQMILRREKAAGISLGTHAWRRKFAGDWIAKGGSEVGLMSIAGWTSTKMVAHYSKSVAQDNALAEQERLMG